MKIKKLPIEERPREKLIKKGANNLTNSELLSIILRTGHKKENVIEVSNKLFQRYNLRELSHLTLSTLKKHLGIGDAKASQIVACFELGRRATCFNEDKKPLIRTAKDIFNLFHNEMNSFKKEHFRIVCLNSKKRITKHSDIFIGSLNESVIHPREIFKIAFEENAAAIILIHNHPSGDSSPSDFDIQTTNELFLSGELLGIKVLDHIIIGTNNYFSFKEKNLI